MTADLIALRRQLHANPEVGLHLPRTQQTVLDALGGLPLEITTGDRCTSVTAVLRGAHPGPTVLLRGDMDALPIREDTGLSFAATGDAMHACGHDLHTAALVGAARLLCAERDTLAGAVVFMFQPGEEGHGGAQAMLDEGLLDVAGTRPDVAYALHVLADKPHGLAFCRPGPIMAAYSVLEVTFAGRGGHGGRPHEALDPVPALAETVTALHTYVARRFDAFDPVVLTVGELRAGSAPNVVPDHAVLRAGVRTFSESATTKIATELPAVAASVAAAHGLTAEAHVRPVMAPTVNDPAAAAVFADTATRLFGRSRYRELEHPRTGSEDFSVVLREIPGAYGYLGVAEPGATAPDGNHSPRARFDDSLLADASALLAGLARHHLLAKHRLKVPQEGRAMPATSTAPQSPSPAAVPSTGRGADVLVDALVRSGVTTVFGVPGDTGVVLYDAFYHRMRDIEHVLARDERHAAYMADAYARVTNRVGVVEVSSGGGCTYAVGGLGDAFASGIPVLLISSDIHAGSRGSGALTEIDQRALFSAVTKAQIVVEHADDVSAAVETALRTATTGRPAPVALIVPENVLDECTSATARDCGIEVPARRDAADEAAIAMAAAAMVGARRPVIVAGGGVHSSGAYDALHELAEALGAGVATTIHGVGAVATSDPWRIGVVGNNSGQPGANAYVASADVVLLVGTRGNATDTNSWTAPAKYGQTVIQLDIEKARAGRNFPGSLPLVGDCRAVLAQLLGAVTPVPAEVRAERLDAVAAARADATPPTASAEYAAGVLYPRAIVETVRGLLGEGTTVIADPGTPTPNVAAFWAQSQPGREVVIPRGHGPMGYAIPAAIGVAKARPGRPVVSVTADGSFAMACGELETAARFELPILFVQLTNHSMGWIKMLQHLYTGGRYFGVDPGPTDAVMVAKANGIDGAAVTSIEEFTKVVKEFTAKPRPYYVDVVVPHMIDYAPPVPAWDAGLAGPGERPVY